MNESKAAGSPGDNSTSSDGRTEAQADAVHGEQVGSLDEALAGFSDQGNEIESATNSPEGQIAQLNAQLQEAHERILRTQADLDNFRKRARREIEDERRFAALPLLRDLLPVIDNLNRAIIAVPAGDAAGGLLEGVKMVEQHLRTVLQNHNCEAIEAEGQPFDPMRHEAIGEHPSAEHPKGTILLVAQTGYRLHDRVIRPSQVIVSKDAT